MKTLTLLAAFFALTLSSYAQNGADQYKDVDVTLTVYNECCDEYIEISGTGHVVIRNGTFNNSHIDVKGLEGYGSNGNYYTQRGAGTQLMQFNEDGTEGTFVFQVQMVGENGCSFRAKITQHITINANGEMTANVEKVEFECLD